MKRCKVPDAVLLGCLIALLWSGPAAAQSEATDTLNLIEISPGVILGNVRVGVTFVGVAFGDLPGAFTTSINYTPPAPGANVTNTILSGKWNLGVFEGESFVGLLRGRVTGGTAQWNSEGTLAAVTATLAITGGTDAFAGTSGSGQFSGTLSHLTAIPTLIGTLNLTLD
jgi:hypothetical protein